MSPLSDEFDVQAREHALSPEVVDNRIAAAALHGRLRPVLEPRIAIHLDAATQLLDYLDRAHTDIADKTDLALDGDTRQAAVWVVSGRCIGLGRAVVHLLRGGFCAEAAAQARVLHEANRVLGAIGDIYERALLGQWLEDADRKWVRPWECRDAGERQRARNASTIEANKANAEAAGDLRAAAALQAIIDSGSLERTDIIGEGSRKIYDVLSRIGHNRRSGTTDAVSVPLRRMATGPHPDLVMRGEYVDGLGRIIEEVALYVGQALGRFYGPGFFTAKIKPLVIGLLHRVREDAPLDPDTLRQLARAAR
ncbi:MAG TPA: hypothetical protein VF250_05490 [Conexibacter sp.]